MKQLFVLASALFIFVSCAKNRGVEPLRPEVTKDWLSKNDILGRGAQRDRYFAKLTVVKNSLDGGFVFAGFQSDMKVGYFDFNETKLQFKSLQGQYKGRESSLTAPPVVFQWPVTHHEAQLQTIDGKTTNKEIDDDRKPWNLKNSFKVDLGAPDVTEEDTFLSADQCWQVASRRRLENSVQVEPGYFSFVVEVLYKRHCPSAKSFGNGHTNFLVQYRYSFRKMEENDYQPFSYSGEQDSRMRKFGYFQSIYEETNPEDDQAKNIFFINRWHPNKTHAFYFTKDFPQAYKSLYYDIFDKTNKVFADAKLAIRFELHENYYHSDPKLNGKVVREFGDLRYSFINLIEELDPSAPLGYGPSDANPYTGEIIAANLNVWSGMIKYYLKVLEQSAERNPQWYQNSEGQWLQDFENSKYASSDLYQRMKTILKQDPQDWTQAWNDRSDLRSFFQHMVKETTYGFPGWNRFANGHEASHPVLAHRDYPVRVEGFQNGSSSSLLMGIREETSQMPEHLLHSLLDFKTLGQTTFARPKSLIGYRPLEENLILQQVGKSMAGTQIGAVNGAHRAPDMEFLKEFSQGMTDFHQHQERNVSLNLRGHCILDMQQALAGLEPTLLEGFDKAEIARTIIYRTSIHEFGHNLNLRHNFYGSVDKENFLAPSIPMYVAEYKPNDAGAMVPTGQKVKVLDEQGNHRMWPTVSSSVMDYMRLQDEYYSTHEWEPYDIAALRYAYSGGKLDDGKTYLFCTDEHTLANALCNRFDKGTTPTEVMMSLIEAYEDGYFTRNYRFGRAYWNTGGYMSGIIGTMRELKEFLPMWRTAFFEANLRDELSKQKVNTHQAEQTIIEMNRDIKQAIRLSIAFYQAVLQQTAAEKPFRSEYDPFSGALKRMGIASDKLAAMYFLTGDDQLYYNPNRVMLEASYLTYSGVEEFAEMMDKIVENVVTQRVDMEPWFISMGRQLYAQSAMNFSNRTDETFINKMKIKKYTAFELKEYFDYIPKDLLVTDLFTLTKSQDADFVVGKEVGLVRVNSNYYMFSKTDSPFAYDIYKSVKSSEEFESSSVEGRLDIQELYYIYTLLSGGTL